MQPNRDIKTTAVLPPCGPEPKSGKMARNRRMSILIWQTKRPRGASLIFSRGERGKGFVSPQHMMPPDGLLLRNNSCRKSAVFGAG